MVSPVAVPAPAFIVKVYSAEASFSHCAYIVVPFALGLYTSPPFPTFVPPELAVYQPFSVYPVLVGLVSVIPVCVYCAVKVPSLVPNVYVEPDIEPPPDNDQPLNLNVDLADVDEYEPSLFSKYTVYELGAVGFVIVILVPEFPWKLVSEFAVPAPTFNVTFDVTIICSHCAYIVVPFALGLYTSPPFPTFVPPELAVYHPLSLYPVLVGLVSVIPVCVYCAVKVPSVSPNVYV